MLLRRRDFLKTGSLATASLLIPRFLKAAEGHRALPFKGKSLVVIQLSGGNDGLNTVIPVRNDVYYRERPGIGIKREGTLSLTDDVSLHPSLGALKNLWDDGSLAILNSVGYPNPDRSHFRSMDIWQTGSSASEVWQTGWLGRYLDNYCAGQPASALEFDDTLSLVLKGERNKGMALHDTKRLYEATRGDYFAGYAGEWKQQEEQKNERDPHWLGGGSAAGTAEEPPLDYLYKTMSETLSSAHYLYEQSRKKPATGAYPATGVGKDLKAIASLILSDTETAVYYVSIGSFDTHIRQEAQQKRLFTELSDALTVFAQDLKTGGKWQDVLVMTFSEFGRRVSQNASGGTDHGTANNMFFMGGGLRQKGLLNEMPDLRNLDQGDLKYQVDFRQAYATVLEKWLQADATVVLNEKFPPLGFV